MITFKHISKTFNNSIVLKDIDFTINEGEIIRISGTNGCGKSTLLKIATGLLKPSSGEVIYNKYSNEIGALIENPSFIENETAIYNLKFLFNLKNKFDEPKVSQLLTEFKLNPYSKIPIKKYSVGMRQKVGIIQAIMENQKIIYFDEPTRGLDEESVELFYNLINNLNKKENKTIIICSHEPLEKICFNKEYVIADGILNEKV